MKEFLKYANEFLKDGDCERNDLNYLRKNEVPYDSVDRIYALYVIDTMPHLLDIDLSTQENIHKEFDKGIPKEIEEEFQEVTYKSYNNYEREGMSQIEAYINIINIAKKGKEETLKDSYYTNGYFGAS